jgi:hypothetical protein
MCAMRRFLLLAGAALAVAVAVPAVGATPATFSITAGSLSLSAPTSTVSLGTQTASGAPSILSGTLGTVSVTDNRGGVTGWTASVISTAFTPPTGAAVAATSVSYLAGTVAHTGVGTFTPLPALSLAGVAPVVVAAVVVGVNSASWNPTISIAVPAALDVGVYSATVTHSVA